jgi:hypothetical protein
VFLRIQSNEYWMHKETRSAYSSRPSFAATEVASHWFGVEIARRLAAAECRLGRGTLRGAPRHPAVTTQHGRAKTPDRIRCREQGRILVGGPVTLSALPRRERRMEMRHSRTRRHVDEEQRAHSDTQEEESHFARHDGHTPSLRSP